MPILMEEQDIFKLNPKREKSIEEIDIGGSEPLKIARIHNIYENPEVVREVFLNAPHTLSPAVTMEAPWWRARFTADIREVYGELIKTIKSDLDPKFKLPFRSIAARHKTIDRKLMIKSLHTACDNFIQGCPGKHIEKLIEWQNKRKLCDDVMLTQRSWSVPHCDPDHYGCSIWLNDQETCSGGTGFYKHIASGLTSLEEFQKLFVEKDQYYMNELVSTFYNKEVDPRDRKLISDSNDKWELKHVEKMEFNTAVLYNGNFFHAAYLKEGMFKDHYRLSQIIFIYDNLKSLRSLGPSTTKIFNDIDTLKNKNGNSGSFDEDLAFTYSEYS